MPRIAVSGHRDLYGQTAVDIRAELRTCLSELAAGAELVGVSCLAEGADSLFAATVFDLGGTLVAVVPASDYRKRLPPASSREYDRLLSGAEAVIRLRHKESSDQTYMDGSMAMLDGADHLIAVWDGRPAAGYGGTADVVAYARAHGIEVTVIWPPGARRGG